MDKIEFAVEAIAEYALVLEAVIDPEPQTYFDYINWLLSSWNNRKQQDRV
jgi:hypothetical protein